MTRTLLSQTAGVNQASVMAVWAIAWAGSKPLASITDGLLAGWIGVRWTGMILAIPAFLPIAALVARAWMARRPASVTILPVRPSIPQHFTVLPGPMQSGPRPAAPSRICSVNSRKCRRLPRIPDLSTCSELDR